MWSSVHLYDTEYENVPIHPSHSLSPGAFPLGDHKEKGLYPILLAIKTTLFLKTFTKWYTFQYLRCH